MIYVLIPTYNRPQALAQLIGDLRATDRELRLVIVNDGSTSDYGNVVNLLTKKDTYIRAKRNHGKQEFYKIINVLFSELKGKDYDYVYKLDDDLRLADNFFDRSIELWKSIPDKRKMAMGLMADSRTGGSSWNGVPSQKVGKVWKQGWIDMIWMCNKGFLSYFGYELPENYFKRKKENGFWKEYPHRSSQVGKWLTLNIWSDGRFWNVDETLVYHGSHESKLNPLERKRNPLKS